MSFTLGMPIDAEKVKYFETYYLKLEEVVESFDKQLCETLAVYRGRVVGESSMMGGGESLVDTMDFDNLHVFQNGECVKLPGINTFKMDKPTALKGVFHRVSLYAIG
jgi:hypothetical protein